MRKVEITKIVAKLIKEGKVIVFPTDTVYGLVCDATNQKAIQKLFKIKKRDLEKPIPVFVKDIEMVKQIAMVNEKQESFFKKVWPGKVTVILRAKIDFPQGVLGEDKTIGLRIPDYAPLNALFNKINKPLSGTSANLAGEHSCLDINDIVAQFANEKLQPDLIVDAGTLNSSQSSTVVDLTGKKLKVLRKGDLKEEELMKYFQ